MRRLLYLPLLLVIVLATDVGSPTAAQEACTLDPVTLPLFDATPAAEVPGALATPALPANGAKSADDEHIATFTAAIDVLLPCIGSGDRAVSFAVFTERYLAARMSDTETVYQPDVERAIADSAGSDDGTPLVVESVSDVAVWEDGRLAGRVTLGDGSMSWTDILVLSDVDGTWLIDDVIPVSR